MKCHYAVLGLELTADQDQIKKAYRKLALKWHPDKNLANVDEANENFRIVQAAYDVLSDPQEKAWYDRNREEILHKKQFANFKENSLDLFDYFTPSCYRGYGDDEKGFYAVYRKVFETIDKEDDPFRSSDSDSDDEMPTFGEGESDYETVVYEFYAAWDAYRTRMTFVWVDQYDKNEAPNRRVMRLVEKENKKERDKSRKKRNELVHDLVSFVRKRDPRVKAYRQKLQERVAENEQRAEEQRLAQMRAKVQKAADYELANKETIREHHEKVAQLENMMKGEFGFSSSEGSESERSDVEKDAEDEEEEYSDELYCVACNKQFKTNMAKRNHEKSKKHKEKVNLLHEELKNDEEQNDEDVSEEEEEENFEINKKLTKKQKKQMKQQSKLLNNSMAARPMFKYDFDAEDEEKEAEKPEAPIVEPNEEEETETKNKKSGKKKRRKQKNSPGNVSMNDDGNTATADGKQESAGQIMHENGDLNEKSTLNTTEEEYEIISSENVKWNPKTIHETKIVDGVDDFNCQICSSNFNTRNKLFKHIKSTGHAVVISNGQSEVVNEKSKKKKGRRKK